MGAGASAAAPDEDALKRTVSFLKENDQHDIDAAEGHDEVDAKLAEIGLDKDTFGTKAVKKLWSNMSREDKAALDDDTLVEALSKAYYAASGEHHDAAPEGATGTLEIIVHAAKGLPTERRLVGSDRPDAYCVVDVFDAHDDEWEASNRKDFVRNNNDPAFDFKVTVENVHGPSQFPGTPDCNGSAALHSYGLDSSLSLRVLQKIDRTTAWTGKTSSRCGPRKKCP